MVRGAHDGESERGRRPILMSPAELSDQWRNQRATHILFSLLLCIRIGEATAHNHFDAMKTIKPLTFRLKEDSGYMGKDGMRYNEPEKKE